MLKIEKEKKKDLMMWIDDGLSTKSIVMLLDDEIEELENNLFPISDIAIMIIHSLKLNLKVTSLTKSMNDIKKSKTTDTLIDQDYVEEALEWFVEDKKDGLHTFHFCKGGEDA